MASSSNPTVPYHDGHIGERLTSWDRNRSTVNLYGSLISKYSLVVLRETESLDVPGVIELLHLLTRRQVPQPDGPII
jgi:hypothetical protein